MSGTQSGRSITEALDLAGGRAAIRLAVAVRRVTGLLATFWKKLLSAFPSFHAITPALRHHSKIG
jgi:hypothetical protein